MTAEKLYTPELLAAAVELAHYPPLETAHWRGSARAPTCGSIVDIDIMTDLQGKIARVGMTVRACAVGQAAAAVFARHAMGHDPDDIRKAHDCLAAWLDEGGPAPEWPDLDLIAPARSYRARHGAMLLPWKAATAALSSAPTAS